MGVLEYQGCRVEIGMAKDTPETPWLIRVEGDFEPRKYKVATWQAYGTVQWLATDVRPGQVKGVALVRGSIRFYDLGTERAHAIIESGD